MSPTIRDGRGQRSTFGVDLAGSGAGPIQRRVAGDDERDGFAPRVVSPGLPKAARQPARVARAEDLTPEQQDTVVALVNADRADRGEPLLRLADPPVTPVTPVTPEEPAVESVATLPPAIDDPGPPAEPLGDSLQILADAAASAAAAWSTMEGASHASRSADAELARAEAAWDGARAALEASWRATGIGRIDILERVVVAAGLGVAAGRIDALGLQDHPAVVAAIDEADAALGSLAERRHEQLLNGDPGYVAPSRIDEVLERRAARELVESQSDHAETIPVADRLTDPGPIDRSLDTHSESIERADDAPEVVTQRGSRETADAAAAADLEADRARKAAAEAGGGPGRRPLTGQEGRVVQAAERNRGKIKDVAVQLGISDSNARMTLERVGRKGGLSIELISLLPAGFAKYRGA